MKPLHSKTARLVAGGSALYGLFLLLAGNVPARADELFKLHPERKNGFANGGWSIDRYKDIAKLDAGKRMFNNINNEDSRPAAREKAAKTAKNWDDALARDGCWVDYAHVFYWYQDQPGGFEHQPLPPVEERMKTLLRSSKSKSPANPVLPSSASPANSANKNGEGVTK